MDCPLSRPLSNADKDGRGAAPEAGLRSSQRNEGAAVSTPSGNDPFEGLEISEEWVASASKREESASQRSIRYRQISRADPLAAPVRKQLSDRPRRGRRRAWRKHAAPWIAFALARVLVLAASMLLRGAPLAAVAATTG